MNMDWFDQSNPSVSGCALLKIDGDTNCCSFNFYPYAYSRNVSVKLYHQLVGAIFIKKTGRGHQILCWQDGRDADVQASNSRALPSSLTHTHWHIKRQLMIDQLHGISLLLDTSMSAAVTSVQARQIPASYETTSSSCKHTEKGKCDNGRRRVASANDNQAAAPSHSHVKLCSIRSEV